MIVCFLILPFSLVGETGVHSPDSIETSQLKQPDSSDLVFFSIANRARFSVYGYIGLSALVALLAWRKGALVLAGLIGGAAACVGFLLVTYLVNVEAHGVAALRRFAFIPHVVGILQWTPLMMLLWMLFRAPNVKSQAASRNTGQDSNP